MLGDFLVPFDALHIVHPDLDLYLFSDGSGCTDFAVAYSILYGSDQSRLNWEAKLQHPCR